MGLMQNVVDKVRGNRDDPKAIADALNKLGRDRETQAAIENAGHICSQRILDGQMPPEKYYSCQAEEFRKQMERPTRIGTEFAVKQGV
jgi:hypothetical protein